MTSIRRRTALVPVLVAIGLLAVAVAPTRAGVACQLQVSSESSPTPGLSTVAVVGEEVTLNGLFGPNADVTFTFQLDGAPVEIVDDTAEADGTLTAIVVFEEFDIGQWEIFAITADGLCSPSVGVTVVPDGPFGSVTVGTAICPAEIQSAEDLEAAGVGACDVAVLPKNEPTVPDGHTSNLTTAEFDYLLTTAEGLTRGLESTVFDGGGMCNPATLKCTFAFGYRWDFAVVGPAELAVDIGPEGHRLGVATVSTIADPPSSIEATVDLGAGTVAFEQTEEQLIIELYWFAVEAPAGSPDASVAPTQAVGSLPDTRARPVDVTPIAPFAAATLATASLVGLLITWRRRSGEALEP